MAAIFLLLGLLDFDSAVLPPLAVRLPLALGFFVPGGLLGCWARLSFPFRNTLGLGGRLIAGGPCRFSRNPQNISNSLSLLGSTALTNSRMACILGV